MVSIIIPTTSQGFVHLAKLLPLLSQEPDSEMIIIDNGSHDGTTNYLSNFDCRVIINKSNLGFAKAINDGVEIARGEHILVLNNDTIINPGFVAEMRKTFDLDPKIAIVGCLIMQMGSEKKVQNCGVCFTQEYVPYELGLEKADITPQILFNDPRVHSVREVPAVTGACMMIKKEIWNQLGGFNENFINGWEDNDFCLRAREAGYIIYYTGKTFITHLQYGSRNVGRFNSETQNRQLYDNIWVTTGRAKQVLGKFRQ